MRRSVAFGIFLKTFCIAVALLVCVSPFVSCFAAAVKVPVFTAVPTEVTTVAGQDSTLDFSSKIFGDTQTEIKYSLEVLKFGRFCSSGEVSEAVSGESATLVFSTGKGSVLFLNHGTYTARLRATSVDSAGNEIVSAFSPVFEIKILPPAIRDIVADARIYYGGEFQISASLNSFYEDEADVSFLWYVSDGENARLLSEGETIKGVKFFETSSGTLKLQGKPEEIFKLTFSVAAELDGVAESAPFGEVTVEFRHRRINGFSLGDEGMRFFRTDGEYVVGWLKHHGDVYYFEPENGIMATGSKVIDGKRCVFGADGRLVTGFYKTPLGFRYFENGRAVEGWYEADGVLCYFDPYTGYMTAKKDAATGKTVYFSDYGSRQSRLSQSN